MKIEISHLDLEKIHASGQCFRWQKLEDGAWQINTPTQGVRVMQKGEQFDFSCTQAEFDAYWRGYFDLDTDYAAVLARVDGSDPYLQEVMRHSDGVRILHQDLWEMIVSFIVSQNNNIPRIRKILAALCAAFAPFPTPSELAGAEEAALRALGLGYRAAYLLEAGKYCEDARHLQALLAMSYEQSHAALCTVKGIGPKVADCICLFGLHHTDAFPIDTHVRQILSAHYKNGFPFERYKGCAGIVQQFMFYYELQKNEFTS